MNKVRIRILNESCESPAGMMSFLAQLTQKGHKLQCMEGLEALYKQCMESTTHSKTKSLMKMPHGTIKRFSPITVAIVGSSRRFLAQARTHQVGLDFVSASLQYSDYSEDAKFFVPYEILTAEQDVYKAYQSKMALDAAFYKTCTTAGLSNDTAGYAMNQALRNILVIQGNHQAWEYFIRTRGCNRNTAETQYIALKLWSLLKNHSADGEDMFGCAGPDCINGKCREGKMSCGTPILCTDPDDVISAAWPKLHTTRPA